MVPNNSWRLTNKWCNSLLTHLKNYLKMETQHLRWACLGCLLAKCFLRKCYRLWWEEVWYQMLSPRNNPIRMTLKKLKRTNRTLFLNLIWTCKTKLWIRCQCSLRGCSRCWRIWEMWKILKNSWWNLWESFRILWRKMNRIPMCRTLWRIWCKIWWIRRRCILIWKSLQLSYQSGLNKINQIFRLKL